MNRAELFIIAIKAITLLVEAREEIQNCYGRDTELTDKISKFFKNVQNGGYQMINDKIHELKILPEYFELVRKGIKNFEVRKNDRDFKVGDKLFLKEWDGDKYTGREQRRKIGYILDNKDYCKEGYVILGFDVFYNML